MKKYGRMTIVLTVMILILAHFILMLAGCAPITRVVICGNTNCAICREYTEKGDWK